MKKVTNHCFKWCRNTRAVFGAFFLVQVQLTSCLEQHDKYRQKIIFRGLLLKLRQKNGCKMVLRFSLKRACAT